MARSSNANAVNFGFDFQVNATIFLLLDNIKELQTVRMEGASEDIELTLNSGKQIMAQAKSVVKGSTDFSHVRSKLKKAIGTLSAADSSSVEQLILITNSTNPLKDEKSKGYFYGPPTRRSYDDLPDESQKIIDGIVEEAKVPLDKHKFQIYFFMFETDNLKERYKVIEEKVRDFITMLDLGRIINATELMTIWQSEIFHNGATSDVSIKLNKKEVVWPVIALTLGKELPAEYIDDYDEGLIEEISIQYAELIDNLTERYDLVTRILYDYKVAGNGLFSKEQVRKFIIDNWRTYVEVLSLGSLPDEVRQAVTKVVLAKIIQQRTRIDRIRKEVSL